MDSDIKFEALSCEFEINYLIGVIWNPWYEVLHLYNEPNNTHLFYLINIFFWNWTWNPFHFKPSYKASVLAQWLRVGSVPQAHPGISQDDKGYVCKYLNCQKLSQEMCIEAVQNELMPLRLIVQALFVQQLNTHRAFKECSESFRYTHGAELSGSPSSSRYGNSKSQNLSESPYIDGGGEAVSRPLSFLIQRDIAIQRSECSRKEYESTSFRIQSLEQELMSLKKSLQLQNMSPITDPVEKKPEAANPQNLMPYSSLSRKKNPLGQVSACIGSVNFATHRKYASRILKVFRRMSLFGRKKSKEEPGASTIWA